jgi:hypothetical protein
LHRPASCIPEQAIFRLINSGITANRRDINATSATRS